jgi:hypothetical protein
MRYLRNFVFLALIVVLGKATILSAQDEAPPYLYYYSRMLGGIIIERADGSDSRIIGEDAIPAGMDGLVGPGWSPSGRYFAAYSISYGDYRSSTGRPYLIDVRGKALISGEYLSRATYDMKWSPDGSNLLLIVGSRSGAVSPEIETTFWVVDAETGAILVDFGLVYNTLRKVTWEVKSNSIIAYSYSELYRPLRYFRTTLQLDGTVIKESISEREFQARTPLPHLGLDDGIYYAHAFSPSGTYEAHDKFPSYLRNRLTGEEIELATHSQGTSCRAYRWSADEQYIITLDGTILAGGGCGGSVLGVTDYHGELWRELGGCSWNMPPCVGWLPGQVNVNHLPRGQSQPIQLDPIGFETAELVTYMRDTNFRFRCGKDHTRYVVDAETNEALFELFDDQHCPSSEGASRSAEFISITFAYDPINQLLATAQGYESVSIWFMRNGVGKLIKQLNTYGFELEFTSDGDQLRARNRNAWKIYNVADILNTADYNN